MMSNRAKNKKETIQKWIHGDRKRQDRIDRAVPPTGVLCKQCLQPINFIFKDLWQSNDENTNVLFFFECLNCKKRRAIYEDGTEWFSEIYYCPECKASLSQKSKFANNIITTVYSCLSCSCSRKEIIDFKSGKTDVLFSTRVSRGIDFPGEQCNSIIFTKYPNPDVKSAFWRILKQTKPTYYWSFYKDKAQRELWQRVYRGLRFKEDHVFLLSPDERVLGGFER